MLKVKRNADYLAIIDKSMAEAEAGEFITKTIAELEASESVYIYVKSLETKRFQGFFRIFCLIAFCQQNIMK